MSLNGVIGNALSGLQAAQLGMRTASNNVSNVNTPGYARTELNQTARNAGGQGMGVEIIGVQRVTDRYLQAASMRAASDASAATALAEALGREAVFDLIATVGFYSVLGYILMSYDTPIDDRIAEEMAEAPL